MLMVINNRVYFTHKHFETSNYDHNGLLMKDILYLPLRIFEIL